MEKKFELTNGCIIKKTGELTFNMINHDKILFEKCSYCDFIERINERDRRNN